MKYSSHNVPTMHKVKYITTGNALTRDPCQSVKGLSKGSLCNPGFLHLMYLLVSQPFLEKMGESIGGKKKKKMRISRFLRRSHREEEIADLVSVCDR